MRIYQATELVAWHCANCGRIEDMPTSKLCQCGESRVRSSHAEWRLIDALAVALTNEDRDFEMIEQYPLRDPRGFLWHFDVAVFVQGSRGCSRLIEVQGPSHRARHSRDTDKALWAAENGLSVIRIEVEDCQPGRAVRTAVDLAADLVAIAG